MKIYFYIGIVSLLVLFSFNSCKKQDYDTGFTTLGEVFFIPKNVASALVVKVGNTPIDWQDGTGKIRVPEGENTFVFYDHANGIKLGEKTVNIIAGSPETYNLFQPAESDPVAFLDPNGQKGEEAAPDGFMKLKIANYAGTPVPKELDLVVIGLNENLEIEELATLESVRNNIGEEQYRKVPTGKSDIIAYTFKFRDRTTQKFVKNIAGDDYWNQSNLTLQPGQIFPAPVKRIYTIYLKTVELPEEYPTYIKAGDKYYDIDVSILYAD